MTRTERRLFRENQILRERVKAITNRKEWLCVKEVAAALGLHQGTIARYCAEGKIDPSCGKKVGGRWFFRAAVIRAEGLLLVG